MRKVGAFVWIVVAVAAYIVWRIVFSVILEIAENAATDAVGLSRRSDRHGGGH